MKIRFFAFMIVIAAAILLFSFAEASALTLPAGLQTIEAQAFMGDTSLDVVVLPEHVETIGAQAFANSSISSVYLPSSLQSIADDAFDGCDDVVVTADEGSYAYVWAVTNGLIKVEGGEAGSPTKVVVQNQLRAGADLSVQVFGPEDTVRHTVYLVDNDTGESKSNTITNQNGTVSWCGYELDAPSYSVVIYTVTRAYNALEPVRKTVEIIDDKWLPSETVTMPESMEFFNYTSEFDCPFNGDIEQYAVETKYHADEEVYGVLEGPYVWRFGSTERFWIDNPYDFINGGTITLRFSAKQDGLWSDWTEEHTITITNEYGKIIGFDLPDVIPAGKDLSISFTCDSRVYNMYVYIYNIRTGENCFEHYFDVYDGNVSFIVPGYKLTDGEYSFELSAQTTAFASDDGDGYLWLYTGKHIIGGEQPPKPSINADVDEIAAGDSFTLYYSAEQETSALIEERIYGQSWTYDPSYQYGNYTGILSKQTNDDIYWIEGASVWYYEYRIAILVDDTWSEWSEPVTITVNGPQPLQDPTIEIAAPVNAGSNLVVTITTPPEITICSVTLCDEYSGDLITSKTISTVQPATATDLVDGFDVTFEGFYIMPGSYRITVDGDTNDGRSRHVEEYIEIPNNLQTPPNVTADHDYIQVNDSISFTIDTTDADAVYITYECGWRSGNATPSVLGNTTVWQYQVPSDMEGNELDVSVMVHRNGRWTDKTSISYMIEGLPQLDPPVIHAEQSYEAGANFVLWFDPVANASNYVWAMFKSDGSVRSDSNVSPQTGITVYGYEFEEGDTFRFVVGASAENYKTSKAEVVISIIGQKPIPPIVTANSSSVYQDEQIEFTIDTINAERIRYQAIKANNNSMYSSGSVSVQGNTTKWLVSATESVYYRFSIFGDNKWSAWSEPILVTVLKRPQLNLPTIKISGEISAGADIDFSFDPVANAESYYVYLRHASGDSNIYSIEQAKATPATNYTIPGYLLDSGTYYTLYVEARASEFSTGTASQIISVSGNRETGPNISSDHNIIRIKDKVSFTIDSENADSVRVSYKSNWYSGADNLDVTGDATTWQYTIPSDIEGQTLTISAMVRRNGRWTKVNSISYIIQGLQSLANPVIHAEESYVCGSDFVLRYDAVENATQYEWYLYKGSEQIRRNYGTNTPAPVACYGYNTDPGTYRLVVYASSNNYSTSSSEITFTVSGNKPQAPAANVDLNSVGTNDRYTFTIDTTGAEMLRYQINGGNDSGNINVFSNSTKWIAYQYSAGTYSYRFCTKINGLWTEWSEPITITVTAPTPPSSPEVSVSSTTVSRYQDIVVTVSAVEGASMYYVYLYDSYNNQITYSTINEAQGGSITLNAYKGWPLEGMEIRVTASNGKTSSDKVVVPITVTDDARLAAPIVTPPEQTNVSNGSRFTFAIDTQGAINAAVRYYTIGYPNNANYTTINVGEDGITNWSTRIYDSQAVVAYSFSVCIDGVWSEWSDFYEITVN